MTSNEKLICFNAISTFVEELAELFGKKHHPLKLYSHLLQKTTLMHKQAIDKHVKEFTNFCVSNRESIINKDYSKFDPKQVVYSPNKVFIDMHLVFSSAEVDDRSVMWKHLLTISAIVDPTGRAREILKESVNKGENTGEANFLSDIIKKVGDNVDENASPMEAVSGIMNSGIFSELITGMTAGLSSGELDLGNLMQTVQKLTTTLGAETQGDPNAQQGVNMIQTMMAGLGNVNTEDGPSGGAPDMAGLMQGMMQGLMSHAPPPPTAHGPALSTIEEVSDEDS